MAIEILGEPEEMEAAGLHWQFEKNLQGNENENSWKNSCLPFKNIKFMNNESEKLDTRYKSRFAKEQVKKVQTSMVVLNKRRLHKALIIP